MKDYFKIVRRLDDGRLVSPLIQEDSALCVEYTPGRRCAGANGSPVFVFLGQRGTLQVFKRSPYGCEIWRCVPGNPRKADGILPRLALRSPGAADFWRYGWDAPLRAHHKDGYIADWLILYREMWA